jgi:iodotyrosine deiodinase
MERPASTQTGTPQVLAVIRLRFAYPEEHMVLAYCYSVWVSLLSMSPAEPFIPLVYQRPTEDEQVRSVTTFAESMSKRRTVRHFSAEPVRYELIEQAIRAAASAPSWANKAPWRFVVVENTELKRRIRAAAEREEREFHTHRATPEWLEDLAPLGLDWHKPFLDEAPYLIVVFRLDYELRVRPNGTIEKHKNYYVQESVGIAVGLLLAALHQAGLATMTHTPNPMNFLCKELGRPDNERPFVVVPTGYPAENAMVPNLERKALSDVLIRL